MNSINHFIVGIIVTILVIIGLNFLLNQPKCVSSHEEIRYKEAYTTLDTLYGTPWIGKGVPITKHHEGYYYEITVCDEYETN